MIDSLPAEVTNAERFERIGVAASASTASRTRDDFARWLGSFFDIDPTRSNDMVLAINEALANSVEHAYPTGDTLGTTDVRANYDPVEATLTVSVSDRGVWRMPDPKPVARVRGRGIPLMSALADRADFETSSDGTLVSLAWGGVHRRRS